MTTLLQISDPHFGTERPRVMEALRRLSRQLAPDVLVLSGDITQRARAAQFNAARAFVDSLNIGTLLAIPGNHDIPLYNVAARVLCPYANHRRVFGNDLEPVLDTTDLLVLCVNCTRWYRHEDGEVSRAQVIRVARLLEAARPGQLRIVVTHQPVAVTRPQDEKNVLHGSQNAIQSWSRSGCDLILGGHIHLPFVLSLHERQVGLPRRIWAVQAGTALSTRVRHEAGNSVNVIRCGADSGTVAVTGAGRRATVERWDYDERNCSFTRRALNDFVLDGASPPTVRAA
ncbi:MAG: metallophosphoesterase [Rhodoferax sp.]|nr:metallophosphoesterase [Rhodoferax sp.]